MSTKPICVILSVSNLLVKLAPPNTSDSPFHSLSLSLNSLIIPFIIPPLVSGILCLIISDLSHNSQLQLPHPSTLSLLFHSLRSLYLAINSSLALKLASSLSYPLNSFSTLSNLMLPTSQLHMLTHE